MYKIHGEVDNSAKKNWVVFCSKDKNAKAINILVLVHELGCHYPHKI